MIASSTICRTLSPLILQDGSLLLRLLVDGEWASMDLPVGLPLFLANVFQGSSCRRKKNQVKGIEDELGRWYTSKADIAGVIERYFTNIFISSQPSEADFALFVEAVYSARLLSNQRCAAELSFKAEEVKQNVFDMGSDKSPGPDDFHCASY